MFLSGQVNNEKCVIIQVFLVMAHFSIDILVFKGYTISKLLNQ